MLKDYKPALREGQKMASTFVEYDIRKPIENLPFTPTEDDVIFNFAAVHHTPGHEDHEYFETNILGKGIGSLHAMEGRRRGEHE